MTEDALDEILARFERGRVGRYLVSVSPFARPGVLPEWLRARGFVRHSRAAKLSRELVEIPAPEAAHLVGREATSRDAELVGELSVQAFDVTAQLQPWFSATVGRPAWTHYLAFAGDQAIATAALFVAGEEAWLGFAGTRASQRGRGAQSELIRQRVAAAARLGARRCVAEAGADEPGAPNTSKRNLIRLGFTVAFERENWVKDTRPGR